MATHSNMLAWRILWMVGHCLSSARYWHPAGAITMSAKGHSIVLSVSYFTVMGNKVRSEKSMSKSPLHWLWNEFLGQQQHCIEYHDSGQSILLKPTDTSFDKSIMSRRGQSISKERIYSCKNKVLPLPWWKQSTVINLLSHGWLIPPPFPPRNSVLSRAHCWSLFFGILEIQQWQ